MKDLTMVSIKMSKELLSRAKEAADNEETTLSALIRKLLLEHLNKVGD